ncbi:MAG: matrixin family metalloprotease [Prosthecobacter sp.]|uniref:matrixin family metalloprotease n=1 Tax=Prosthecobacter sp. TaxID=1965333 RepID=UPI0025FD450D|nr:matrixin family metalloprotease [Prosthecobacter sp.]MCF7785577.1 matrixin family metalloprotease [Prosthecobacter sp.]
MIALYYNAPKELRALADKAGMQWMKALGRTVQSPPLALLAPMPLRLANVIIQWGKVDRSKQPDRVAQHEKHEAQTGTRHVITLADDVKWRISWWQRTMGIGDVDAHAALLHELGHALGLPHSDRESDVMAPDLGTTVISEDEAAHYRQFLTPRSHTFAPPRLP